MHHSALPRGASTPEGGTYVSVVIPHGWSNYTTDLTAVPSASTPGACVNLSDDAAARLASHSLPPRVYVTWSSTSSASGGSPASMCARVRFFYGAGCSGASAAVEVQGGWRAATEATGLHRSAEGRE